MKKFNFYLFRFLLIALVAFSCTEDDGESTTDDTSGENPSSNNELRTEALDLYNNSYLTSELNNNEPVWINGDLSNCDAGAVSEAAKNKMLQRLLYFREVVGLNNNITINTDKSDNAQEAALMYKANGMLSHNPPTSWTCFSEDGALAASKSNIALFSSATTSAIDLYMRDNGINNFAAGHRRWLLWPRLQDIGIGNTDRSNTIWVIGDAGSIPNDSPEFISWPPTGYVPSNLVYNRWSFSLANANFSNTEVFVKDSNGNNIALEIEEMANGFGDNTIVWIPENINTNSSSDVTYTVTLNNVVISGESRNFEYEVILFDVDVM